MTEIISIDELKGKLNSAADQTQRRLYFAALLREAAGIPPADLVVVGGSAIEIYTVGRYTSGDIDIVAPERGSLQEVLKKWEFAKDSRVWHNPELELFIDIVRGPYTGSLERTTLVSTPFGQVRLAAIEDLFVKRLSSAVHWRQKGDIEHAKMLAFAYGDRMDWAYVEKFAAEHSVLDLAREVRSSLTGKPKKRER